MSYYYSKYSFFNKSGMDNGMIMEFVLILVNIPNALI